MNPYYTPPYMQQPTQPIQPLPQHVEPRVMAYQEILSRLAAIEKKIGVVNESNVIDVTE